MVLRNANPLRAVFDCFLDLEDDHAVPLLSDLRVIAAVDDGLYGFDGFFVHMKFPLAKSETTGYNKSG